jgi:hypothetical protein
MTDDPVRRDDLQPDGGDPRSSGFLNFSVGPGVLVAENGEPEHFGIRLNRRMQLF